MREVEEHAEFSYDPNWLIDLPEDAGPSEYMINSQAMPVLSRDGQLAQMPKRLIVSGRHR